MIPVRDNTFWDCGFDPRFTEDGSAFDPQALKESWKDKFHTLLFIFKAYLSPSSEKRKLFKAVLKCSRTENGLASICRNWAVEDSKSKKKRFTAHKEHDFLEASSDLCKILLQKSEPDRLFPCEILRPIHLINKPQDNKLDNKEKIKAGGGENGDLARLKPFGFHAHYGLNNHQEFIKTTEKAADQLKQAIRNWREVIHQSTLEYQNQNLWMQKLRENALKLESAWANYAASNRMVKVAFQVFSERDFYHDIYPKHWTSLFSGGREYEEVSKRISELSGTLQDGDKITLKFGKTDVIIKRGSVLDEEVDAIVNAAKSSLLGGGGIDGAIHERGGPKILEECKKIKETLLKDNKGLCPTGEAVITTAGDMQPKIKYVIHAVGPFGSDANKEELLKSAYTNCLNRAVENQVQSIAFCCISTGIYGYEIVEATSVALQAVKDFCEKNPEIKEIRFMMYLESEWQAYQKAVQKFTAQT
jgi:O-acetyl-ADP-ribose deacetylase (regulator of RNase III)